MSKCIVEVYNNDLKESEWLPGEITGTRERLDLLIIGYDVTLLDGRVYKGCHPDCVRFA